MRRCKDCVGQCGFEFMKFLGTPFHNCDNYKRKWWKFWADK